MLGQCCIITGGIITNGTRIYDRQFLPLPGSAEAQEGLGGKPGIPYQPYGVYGRHGSAGFWYQRQGARSHAVLWLQRLHWRRCAHSPCKCEAGTLWHRRFQSTFISCCTFAFGGNGCSGTERAVGTFRRLRVHFHTVIHCELLRELLCILRFQLL